MTAITPLSNVSVVELSERLSRFADVLEALPERIPDLPSPDGTNGELDRLSASILALANRLAQQHKAEEMLAAVTNRVVQGFQLDQILDHIYMGFRGLLPYDRIGCALLEDNGTLLRARWARSESQQLLLTGGYAERIAGTSLEAVIRSGRPRILNDLVERASRQPVTRATELIMEEGVRSSLTCPLISLGRPVGVLFFSSIKPYQYADVHIELFLQIAGIISTTIEKSVLYDQLNSANEALRKAYAALEIQATQDALTGIKNRRAILDRLEQLRRLGRRETLDAGVMIIDLDHFKSVNDTFGHAGGDVVLREVAQRIASVLRASDEVGRYGGEEFLVCFSNITEQGLVHAATRILDVIRDVPVVIDGQEIRLSASAGVAHRPDFGASDPEAVIREADAALYRAKSAGRDQFCWSAPTA